MCCEPDSPSGNKTYYHFALDKTQIETLRKQLWEAQCPPKEHAPYEAYHWKPGEMRVNLLVQVEQEDDDGFVSMLHDGEVGIVIELRDEDWVAIRFGPGQECVFPTVYLKPATERQARIWRHETLAGGKSALSVAQWDVSRAIVV
jgi:hypothetical protein